MEVLTMAPGLLESATQTTTTTSNSFPNAIPSSKQPANTTRTEISPSTITPTTSPPNTNTLVLDPSLITNDMDRLRFEAAAYTQLPKPFSPNASPPPSSTDLISSPYNNPGHYLSLPTLPLPSALFAKALTALRPTVPDYATAHYTSALNFPHVLAVLRELLHGEQLARGSWRQTSFYVVLFRSKLKQEVDSQWLYKLDYESHAEACASGGLLKYWFGKADGEGRNLATCFWHSRADAVQGGLGPWHKKARAAGRELYDSIVFSTHRFTILDGAEEFEFEDWRESRGGWEVGR